MTAFDHQPPANFAFHMRNIPMLIGEKDSDTYLRAFARMISQAPEADAGEWIIAAATSAVQFLADDAFRSGFESCHSNVVLPLRESTVATSQALEAMRLHGEIVRATIVSKFEEAPGVPNQLTVDIESIELPKPRIKR